MLAINGRIVYSTCSLNPIENESVLYRILKESNGALELVDASDMVPSLKFYKGKTHWLPANRDIEFYEKFEDVPEKWLTTIRPQMFPPSEEDAKKYGLDKCMRILPHLQNTGAFFVAVLEKKSNLPWEKPKVEVKLNENNKEANDNSNTNQPQRKKRRLHGYKEDPYIFFNKDEETWKSIKAFYEINDNFNSECLLTRCASGKKKNIYFCSESLRDLVIRNEHHVKVINTGVKVFARCDNRNMKCAFRLAQEGLSTIEPFIGETRKISLEKDDLIILLQNTDPLNAPQIESLSEKTKEICSNLGKLKIYKGFIKD